jgi:hypothetical protein
MHLKIAKLKKLKKWILDEPRRYNQKWWIYGRNSNVVAQQEPSCGTAACLAGSACLMEGYKASRGKAPTFDYVLKPGKLKHYEVRPLAMKILRLKEYEADQLFAASLNGWPEKAINLYIQSDDPKTHAEAAAMAIDALIKQGRPRKATKLR